ncbi:MAG: hypothetical protein WDO13_21970 [Verrucomicrobiota bacterium]
MRKLRARGYQRIGMVTSNGMDERMDRMWTAAYRAELPTCRRAPRSPFISTATARTTTRPTPAGKREAVPEVVPPLQAGGHPHLVEPGAGMAAHRRLPGAAGRLGGQRGPAGNEPVLAGIVEASREIGSAAADFLVGMLQRGEHGVPRVPQRILLEGQWNEGTTLDRKPSAREALLAA